MKAAAVERDPATSANEASRTSARSSAAAARNAARDPRDLAIAYLTTEYPKVSHTFIRREIAELERLGWSIRRVAIRGGGEVRDPADRAEVERTFVCLDQPAHRFARAGFATLVRHPLRTLGALRTALAMHRRSERGLVRHLAYLAEACVLRGELARSGVEHVHVHFGTNAAAVARLIMRLGGPSYSMTVHGPDEFDAPIGLSLGDKIADARFVAAISDYCVAQLRRWAAPADWPRIQVVRCAVGGAFLDPPAPVAPASRTLLCIGRLSAQKGHLVLLDAAARLAGDGVDFELVLAGDGEMRAAVEQRIAAHRLDASVRITGWVDEAEVRELLRGARALVQPSFAEGLPVVMMEALAMGRPVIASSIAGVPELVRPGENGWLVPAANVDELVDAMREALEMPPAALDEMGRAGRARVLARHRGETEAATLSALLCRYAGAG